VGLEEDEILLAAVPLDRPSEDALATPELEHLLFERGNG